MFLYLYICIFYIFFLYFTYIFIFIFLYFDLCIEILGASPLKTCIAWPSLCYDFPCRKVLAPDYISFRCAYIPSPQEGQPEDMGVPRGKLGSAKRLPPPRPCSFCIRHSRGRSLRLQLISARYRCQNDIFPGKTMVSPILPFTQPAHRAGFGVQAQLQSLGLSIPDHRSPPRPDPATPTQHPSRSVPAGTKPQEGFELYI